ncbi:MAG: leucine-rich repeat protein [Clostridia bacterium]|nr:leucine-rich repeat protein [Clostridia bacterium]
MRKILLITSFILMSAILLCGCNTKTVPDGPEYLYVTYNLDGEDFITLTKYMGRKTDVVVPTELDGLPVTEIGAGCFAETSVVSVTVPDSILVIESGAFSKCAALTSVTLPEEMLYLGSQVFAECTSLKEITLPASGVTMYSWGMFIGSGVESVVLPENLDVLPSNFFLGSALKEITLPAGIKTVMQGALGNCTNLTSVTLNDGLTTIEECAFMSCPNLTEIVIPASVETLTEYAFVGCDALTKVKFEGNATAFKNTDENLAALYSGWVPNYTVYYHAGAEGFTSPEWEGFTTELW